MEFRGDNLTCHSSGAIYLVLFVLLGDLGLLGVRVYPTLFSVRTRRELRSPACQHTTIPSQGSFQVVGNNSSGFWGKSKGEHGSPGRADSARSSNRQWGNAQLVDQYEFTPGKHSTLPQCTCKPPLLVPCVCVQCLCFFTTHGYDRACWRRVPSESQAHSVLAQHYFLPMPGQEQHSSYPNMFPHNKMRTEYLPNWATF